jgi:dihydrofolate reductase
MAGRRAAEGDTQAAKPGREAGFVRGRYIVRRSLMLHGLIDECQLMIHPLVPGTGKRLFREGATGRALQLAEATVPAGDLAAPALPASRLTGRRPR